MWSSKNYFLSAASKQLSSIYTGSAYKVIYIYQGALANKEVNAIHRKNAIHIGAYWPDAIEVWLKIFNTVTLLYKFG